MSSAMEAEVPAMAPVNGGVVAYVDVDGAVAAAEFYEKAFCAKVVARQPVDDKGRTMHVHLHLNGSSIMLSDFYPEHGHVKAAPSGFTLLIVATDIEAQYKRAVDAGCTGVMPPQKMFWGDLFCSLKDPFGVAWAMNQGA
jgi:PhnB protein